MTAFPQDHEPIRALTASSLAELMHLRGYRVERITDPTGAEVLRSATGGLAFEIRLASPEPGASGGFLDFACLAAIRIEGTLDPAVLNAWNDARRFARLHLRDGHLVLAQDVSVAGGVLAGHVLTQLEIWDRLLQDLPGFLRAEVARHQGIPAAVAAA